MRSAAEKPNKLESKIRTLDWMLRRRLIGARWLRERTAQTINPEHWGWRGQGQREAARWTKGVSPLDSSKSEENVIRDYWSGQQGKTAPLSVLHLALATQHALTLANPPGWRWDLERVAFRPDWVAEALRQSEPQAQAADLLGIIPVDRTLFFTRDDF